MTSANCRRSAANVSSKNDQLKTVAGHTTVN